MKPSDNFETGSIEGILLSYQVQACDLWRVNHKEGAKPTESELHELTEALLARRVFELENRRNSPGATEAQAVSPKNIVFRRFCSLPDALDQLTKQSPKYDVGL